MKINDTIFEWLLFFRYPKSFLIALPVIRSLIKKETSVNNFDSKNKLLFNLLKYSSENIPFYKNKLYKIKKENIEEFFYKIPIISKRDYKTNSTSFYSIDSSLAWKQFNTGGSTGEPFSFRLSKTAGIIDYYHHKKFYLSKGYKFGDKILSFDGSIIPDNLIKKNVYWINKGHCELPFGSIHLSSHYFNNSTFVYYLDEYMKNQPEFIRGYPSFVYEFAKKLIFTHTTIKKPKCILLTSEEIFPHQLELIRKCFGCDVYGQYGHSEASIFAISEPNSLIYTCSPLYGFVEIVDDKNQHVEIGMEGEIIVTGFFNFSMPFIRYRTGDRAIYGGNNNGKTILSKILGRTQDYVIDKNNNKIPITGLVFGQHFKAFKSIEKWQIVQNEIGKITVNLIPSKVLSEKDLFEIDEKLSMKNNFYVEIKIVEEIKLSNRGKHRFVINNINAE